jgi:hypothetical protein
LGRTGKGLGIRGACYTVCPLDTAVGQRYLFFLLFLGIFHEDQMYYTRDKVADILDRFLSGCVDPYEFDDFISSNSLDPEIEFIRLRLIDLPLERPSADPNEYADADARTEVAQMANSLRGGDKAR